MTRFLADFDDANPRDESGYNNSMRLGKIGGTASQFPVFSTDCVSGGCYKFNGSTYINASSPMGRIGANLSISFWIKRASTGAVEVPIGNYGPAAYGWEFVIASGKMQFGGRDNSANGYMYTQSRSRIDDNTWHHIAGVLDNNVWKIYVDGSLSNYTQYASVKLINNSMGSVYLGWENPASIYYFNGSLDEISMYSKVLNQVEISQLYESRKAKFVEFKSGVTGKGINFEGLSSRVRVPYSSTLNISKSVTVSAWIYPAANQTINAGIIGRGYISGDMPFKLDFRYGKLRGYVTGNDLTFCVINTSYIPNTWQQVVFTYDMTECKLYLNGAIVGSKAYSKTLYTTSGLDLNIGSNGAGAYYKGLIDEVGIYNTSLSYYQINRMYESKRALYAETVKSTNDSMGYGLRFDATKNQKIEVPGINLTSSSFTLSLWTQTSANLGSMYDSGLIGKTMTFGAGTEIYGMTMHDSGSVRRIYAYVNGGSNYTSLAYPNDRNWHHLVQSYNGSTMKLYIDGVLKNSNTLNTKLKDIPSKSLLIGQMTTYYNGSIDEVVLYKRAYSDAEVLNLYNSKVAKFSSSISGKNGLGWNFDGKSRIEINQNVNPLLTNLNNFTISGWFKTSKLPSSVGMLFSQYECGYPCISLRSNSTIQISINSTGNLGAYLRDTRGATTVLNSSIVVTDNNYHQFIFTKFGSTKKLYLDGVLRSSSSTGATAVFKNDDLNEDSYVLGAVQDNPSPLKYIQYYNGSIDEFSVYKKGFSDAEVTLLYSTQKAKYFESTTGKSGSAFTFDGKKDYVAIPYSSALNFKTGDNYSISMWYNANKCTSEYLIYKAISTQYPFNIVCLLNKIQFRRYSNPTVVSITYPTTLNSWHHVVGVKTGNTLQLYQDGILVNSTTDTLGSLPVNNTQDIVIGKYFMPNIPVSANYFNGSIDEVGVYSRALSSTEVSEMYSNLRAKFVETTTGITGNGIKFDGKTTYIDTKTRANSSLGRNPRTISFWMNEYTRTPGINVGVVDFKKVGSGQSFIIGSALISSNYYIFTDGVNGANNIILSGTDIPSLNTWHHISFSFDGNQTWAYYLDGTRRRTGIFPVAINTSSNEFFIGKREDTVVGYFNGSIDELGIYDKTLSDAEVLDLYNSKRAKFVEYKSSPKGNGILLDGVNDEIRFESTDSLRNINKNLSVIMYLTNLNNIESIYGDYYFSGNAMFLRGMNNGARNFNFGVYGPPWYESTSSKSAAGLQEGVLVGSFKNSNNLSIYYNGKTYVSITGAYSKKDDAAGVSKGYSIGGEYWNFPSLGHVPLFVDDLYLFSRPSSLAEAQSAYSDLVTHSSVSANNIDFAKCNLPVGAKYNLNMNIDVQTYLSKNVINCPSGYVTVPGNSTYSTTDFCVMKYDAKFMNYTGKAQDPSSLTWRYDTATGDKTPVSVAAGQPISYISWQQAKTACTSLGSKYHLITNNEWLTIASNALHQSNNWNSSIAGVGYVYSGHNDNVPTYALDSSSDDLNGYYKTGDSIYSGKNQKRTLQLSNGAVIWDFIGNMWEWTNNSISSASRYHGGNQQWMSYNSNDGTGKIASLVPALMRPPSGWNINQGMGRYFDGTNLTGGYNSLNQAPDFCTGYCSPTSVFVRGGRWATSFATGLFTISLDYGPSGISVGVGFRCAYSP